MAELSNIFLYILIFFSTYIQLFFLVTFIEKHKELKFSPSIFNIPHKNQGVTVIVPCYNEEKTLARTVKSILSLKYPKNKLKIILVDDGSKDGTWNIMKKFEKHPQITAIRKENGGKHTALNLALEHTETPFVGCLDADSFVEEHALIRIMSMFKDPEIMAVIPSIVVDKPKNILQMAQKVEYDMSVYAKKMLSFMNAIHVTPGPFSIFRKKVFDNLGGYRKAHNTEDQEIALRMHANDYKIAYCHDAHVYTVTPKTVKTLYKQRLRWIYGFIQNTRDYRYFLFNKKYGNVAIFTLPSGLISVLSIIFLTGFFISKVANAANQKITFIKYAGINSVLNISPNFDLFFINTKASLFLIIFLYGFLIFSIVIGTRVIEGKWKFPLATLLFIPIYSAIAPFWLIKAIYNSVLSIKPSWR